MVFIIEKYRRDEVASAKKSTSRKLALLYKFPSHSETVLRLLSPEAECTSSRTSCLTIENLRL